VTFYASFYKVECFYVGVSSPAAAPRKLGVERLRMPARRAKTAHAGSRLGHAAPFGRLRERQKQVWDPWRGRHMLLLAMPMLDRRC